MRKNEEMPGTHSEAWLSTIKRNSGDAKFDDEKKNKKICDILIIIQVPSTEDSESILHTEAGEDLKACLNKMR